MIRPISIGKNLVFSMGFLKACEWVVCLRNWVESYIPESARESHIVGVNTLANYSQITGLRHAIYSCPWFWQQGSLACYQAGLRNNPIAKTVYTLLTPIRCSLGESDLLGMTGCMLGLNDQGKNDLKEQVEVVTTLAGLLLLWYLTLPTKEKKQEKKPV